MLGGPIIFGTRVLLTRTGSNSILLGIGHCPTYQGRRKLIEKMGQKVCIDSVHTGERQMYVVDVGELVAGQR